MAHRILGDASTVAPRCSHDRVSGPQDGQAGRPTGAGSTQTLPAWWNWKTRQLEGLESRKRRAGSRPAAGTKLLHRWWNWQTRLTQNQANSDVHAGSRPAWCTTNRGDDEHTDPAGSIRSLAGAAPPLCAMLAELEDAAGLSPAAARHPSSRLGHRTSRIFRDVAKQVRHRAHNAAIVGSNPTITTTMPL